MHKKCSKLTVAEKKAWYMEKWKQLNIPLGIDETAIQMNEGDGMYFITNWGRVISLSGWHGTPWRDMTQCKNYSKNSKRTGTSKQLYVFLKCCDGKFRRLRVSRLMAKYFPLDTFNPSNEEESQVHHKKRWNSEEGTANNRVENLQLVGAKAHSTITLIQDGILSENGLEYKNNDKVHKRIAEIAPDNDHVNLLISQVNPETKAVTSSEGTTITYEDAAKIFSGISFEGATIQWNEQYRQRLLKEREEELEAMKLVAAGKGTGRVRVVDGHLQLIKEKEQ